MWLNWIDSHQVSTLQVVILASLAMVAVAVPTSVGVHYLVEQLQGRQRNKRKRQATEADIARDMAELEQEVDEVLKLEAQSRF